MAATLETSQNNGSDVDYDVCCTICGLDGIYKEGRFNCQKCSKYFCDSCVLTHNKFVKDHSVTEKGGSEIWPKSKTVDDALELCDEYTTEKLTMFCEDDEKLLCHVCLLRNHKQCSQIVLLTDKVKSTTQSLGIAQMKTIINALIERLEDMVKTGEKNMMSLQTSYEKALEQIGDVRQLINENLDRLQQNTERKLEEMHSALKTSLQNKRKHCVEYMSILKGHKIEDIHKTSTERSFIMYRKCLDRTTSADFFLSGKETTNAAIEFHHNNDLERLLASCTEFGSIVSREDLSLKVVDPNKVLNLSIKDKSRHKVRTAFDNSNCFIRGICDSSNGNFIMVDSENKCLKLMDQAYNFIMETQLPNSPWSMCNISTNEMALTVGNSQSVNEIHFVRIDKRRIKTFKRLQLDHLCYGIEIHKGDLFVTSGAAVYKYTMAGRLVKKLYEDKLRKSAVVGVGVSPDGKRIYVTDRVNGNLYTLTRDGAVTTTLRHPAFKTSYFINNIHVTANGHVFFLGNNSLSQVYTIGKRVLNTLILDISYLSPVFVNEDVSKMIVGCSGNDVIEVKLNAS